MLPGRQRASAPISRDFRPMPKDHEISDHGPSRGSARPPGPTRYSPVQSQGPNGQLLRPQSRHGTNPHRPHSWPGGCHWCPHTGHLGPSCFLATNRLSPAGRPRALDAGAGDRTDTAVFDLGWPLAAATPGRASTAASPRTCMIRFPSARRQAAGQRLRLPPVRAHLPSAGAPGISAPGKGGFKAARHM